MEWGCSTPILGCWRTQRAEVTGSADPPARAGRELPGLVIDLDATVVVVCHADKQQAAPTLKRSLGYHPMVAFLDNTTRDAGRGELSLLVGAGKLGWLSA